MNVWCVVFVMEKMFDMTQHMAGYGQGQPMDQRFGPMQQAWAPYPSHTSFSPYHPYPRSFDMFQGNFMDGRYLGALCRGNRNIGIFEVNLTLDVGKTRD